MIENIVELAPIETRRRCLKWMSFMMNDVSFWPFGGLVHQHAHWSRVLVLSMLIGSHEGLSDVDLDALASAAAFHDTRRKDSWLDEGHGDRGAEYYREFCEAYGLKFDPRTYLAIQWHDRDDDDGLEATLKWDRENTRDEDWNASATDIYRIFKDSDGLDRLRLSEHALDSNYLRLGFSKTLLPFEANLLHASREAGTWESTSNGGPKKYLVVVDVQNDFVWGSLGTQQAIDALPRMVEKAKSFDGKVIFTKDTHSPGYLQSQEGKNLPVKHCICPTSGWQLVDEMEQIRSQRDGAVYLKPTFASPALARDLQMVDALGGLESVELIGLCTDICVVSNAMQIKAQMPQLKVMVDPNCSAGSTPQAHEAALETLKSCQIGLSE